MSERFMQVMGELAEFAAAHEGSDESTFALPLDVAREVLMHEGERAVTEFEYDPGAQAVKLRGTRLSLGFLDNFRTSSGEDECYQHQRREDGLVIVTRTVGHREQIRMLRTCLDARPRTASVPRLAEWNESAEIALATTPDTIANETGALENLIECARNLRATARDPNMLSDDEAVAGPARHAQLVAGGLLFEAIERLQYMRRKLFLWNDPDAPATSEGPMRVGTCEKCGRTDLNACKLKDGEPCRWANEEHTLCSGCFDEQMMPIEGGAE